LAGLEGMQLGSCHILRRIGGGGMGEVYLAEQPELNRQVAVKVIHGESGIGVNAGAQSKAVEQFTREARAVAALSHPHILPIYDFGEQNGLHYLVMEYVPSGSLANIDITNLSISPEVVASLMLQAGGALQYAHDHHIMHLDVKPQNLLVKLLSPTVDVSQTPGAAQQDALTSAQGSTRLSVLLADFGLARLTTWSAQSSIAGTPLYAAPEQYTGSPSPASDQYALAGVAFLLLTGHNVFTGTLAELYHQHMSVPAPLANTVNPALSQAVSTVLARALAKNPIQRFPSVWEFTQALATAIRKGVAPDLTTAVVTSGSLLGGSSGAPNAFVPPTTPGAAIPSAMSTQTSGALPPAASGMAPQVAPLNATTPTNASPVQATSGALGPASTSGGLSGMSDTAAMQALLPQGIPTRATEQPTYREPDGQLAPLPPERISLPPYWRWVAIGLVAALLVSVGAGIIIARIASQVTPPTLLTPVAAHITTTSININPSPSSNFVPLSHVPRVANGMTANELTTSLALPTALEADAGFSGSNSTLPSVPATQAITVGMGLPSLQSRTVAIPKQTKTAGAGQAETGTADLFSNSIASGGGYVLEAVNGVLFAEATTPNGVTQAFTVRLANFFQGFVQQNDELGEPHIVFDQGSGAEDSHWILVVNAVRIHKGNVNSGEFDVAISSSTDILSGWYLFQFSSLQPNTTHPCNWADDPQIGLAGADLFISAVSYGCGQLNATRPRLGADVWAMPLETFARGNAAQITLLSGFTDTQGRPALNLTPTVAGPNDTTEWLMSDDSDPTDPQATSNRVAIWAIRGVTATSTALSVLSGVFSLPISYADPFPALQRNGNLLHTGDAQISQLLWVNQHLYAALSTGVNWNGEIATRAAVVWFEVTPIVYGPGAAKGATAPGIGLSLNQIEMLGAPGLYVFYPGLAVDTNGNVGVFAQYSNANDEPGMLYAPHYANEQAASLTHPDSTVSISESIVPFKGAYWGDGTSTAMTTLSPTTNTGLVWVAIPYIASITTPKQGKTPAVTTNKWGTAIWQVQL